MSRLVRFIGREHPEAFTAPLLVSLSSATAALHYRSVQQFFRLEPIERFAFGAWIARG